MKGVICVVWCLGWLWHICMCDLSRAYESLFLVCQYDYLGIGDSHYRKELSWGEKIVCLDRYATDEMMSALRNIEELPIERVLNIREAGVTKEGYILGEHCVIKSGEKKGCLMPLFFMGLGVDIWNNAQWMKKKGIQALKPIALIEKRRWNHAISFVVYLYEGDMCEKELKRQDSFFGKIQEMEKKLCQERVIHHDLRLRNMVVLEDGRVQFIDIDKVHWYPKGSYVFHQRMQREVRKFNDNMKAKTGYTGRIEV